MRIIDIILLVAVAVEGVVLYWIIKYGDEFKNERKDEFVEKWKD